MMQEEGERRNQNRKLGRKATLLNTVVPKGLFQGETFDQRLKEVRNTHKDKGRALQIQETQCKDPRVECYPVYCK